MLSNLPNDIYKVNSSSKVLINSLIKEMKLSKQDVNSLVENMSSYNTFSNFTAQKIPVMSSLNREIFVDFFRDMTIRIRQMFSRANSAGLVINSLVDIYSTEIEKLERDIEDLSSFVDNYEFLSGKDDYYNFNYIEKFDNSLKSIFYEDPYFTIPDRDNTPYGENGNSFVDPVLGTLSIGSSAVKHNVINNIKSIKIDNNYENYITSSSDFSKTINDSSKEAWNITIKSPSIIKNNLLQYSKYFDYSMYSTPGAQSAVTIEFNSSINIDKVRIYPVNGRLLKVLQVVVFTDEYSQVENVGLDHEEQYIKCLSQPRILDSVSDIVFPKSLVKKVTIIFNEQGYVRSEPQPIESEVNSKNLFRFINKRSEERLNSFSKMQDVVFYLFRRKNTIPGLKSRDKSEYDYYSYRFPQDLDSYANLIEDELFAINNTDFQDRPIFHRSPIFADLILSISSYLDKDNTFIDKSIFIESSSRSSSMSSLLPRASANSLHDISDQYYSAPVKDLSLEKVASLLSLGESSDSYEYSFGIYSIDFLSTKKESSDKACFVSSRIDSKSQIISLKTKVVKYDIDMDYYRNLIDIPNPYSYEISYSNSQNPSNESDWLPILPYDNEEVESEVLFFDTNTYGAKLRFPAVPTSIKVYKDGMIIPISSYEYQTASSTIYLVNQDIFDQRSIWAIGYTPDISIKNPYELDFEKEGIYQDSSKRFRGTDGLGQYFSKTNKDLSVSLKYSPYVKQGFVDFATYSTQNGTIFSGPANGYTPVRVLLESGGIAANMTNYTKNAYPVTFPQNGNLMFVQSGNKLIFNRAINEGFHVEYDFVPNDTRFRIILRKNIRDSVPGSIDYVIMKAKTATIDPYYDRLRNVG